MVPHDAIMRHNQIQGWSYDMIKIFEIGWKIAKTTDWNLVQTEIGKEQALFVVPEKVRRLKHIQRSIRNVDVFYYKKFSEVHLRKNELFRDELGHVVFVMPSLEPKQTGCWLPFVAAIGIWLGIGCRLYLVAGPIGREQSSWFRVAESARSHVHGYLKYRPEQAEQIVNKLPVSAGVIPADSSCLEVDDDKSWIPEAGVRKFYPKMAMCLAAGFPWRPFRHPSSKALALTRQVFRLEFRRVVRKW
ncbi:unnamed protein product [Heligmosomoides polygyrus]|uniref:PlsC domain-containing protein n=1 Tax=Heligmosomoides polygyrus TaxID=6339 RepID=A0A183FPR0_HELPZ|nr:unnamed protein product [Heligmosomoides polygyrus]